MTDHVTTAAFDAWVRRFAELIAQERDHLTELDSAIGDADHGTNMDRGMKAAVAALDETAPTGAGPLLTKVGMTLVSTVGRRERAALRHALPAHGLHVGDVTEVAPEQVLPASVPGSRVSLLGARPRPRTRRCTTRWHPPWTRSRPG